VTEEVHKAQDFDGSRPLPNRKREVFARMLFEGVEAGAAYELAGFKRPRGNAQRMEREPEIQSRVNFLRQELDAADLALRTVRRRQLRDQLKAITDVDRVDMFEEIEFVKKIGRGRNEREITVRRFQLKPLNALTPEQRALVEGLEADGMRPILPSKLQALALRAKLDGLDAPNKIALTDPGGNNQAPVGPTINLFNRPLDQLTDEELQEEVDAERRRLNLVGTDNGDSRE
jgi:hypothetical protein